jgi:hypothetical protein
VKNAVAVESVVTVALCTGRHTYVGIVADYARALCSVPLNQNPRKERLRIEAKPGSANTAAKAGRRYSNTTS